MKNDVWTTREGVKIPIKEMTNSHILNTITFFYKRREVIVSNLAMSMALYACDAPDGAAMAASQGVDQLMGSDIDEIWIDCMSASEEMWNIIKEARGRNIYMKAFPRK